MPVFRVEKNKDYTTMCNHHLRDENLTLKAKGLLSLFLSLPENWDYSLAGLSKICKEGRSGISSTLKELEECGYLVRERRRDEKGLLRDNIYVIYERPQEKDQHPEAEDLPILPAEWKYNVAAATKKQFDILKQLMNRKDVTEIICATDAGREGELIFRLVYHQCGCKKPFLRLWISSMEDSAIRDGFACLRPGTEYDALYKRLQDLVVEKRKNTTAKPCNMNIRLKYSLQLPVITGGYRLYECLS